MMLKPYQNPIETPIIERGTLDIEITNPDPTSTQASKPTIKPTSFGDAVLPWNPKPEPIPMPMPHLEGQGLTPVPMPMPADDATETSQGLVSFIPPDGCKSQIFRPWCPLSSHELTEVNIYIHTPESCQLVPQDNKQETPQFEHRDDGTLAEKFCERFPGLCDLFEDYPGFPW